MAHDARTRPLPGPIPHEPDAEVDDAFVGVDIVLEKLWHLLTSMRFALVLILGLAVLGLIGTLVIQAPAGVLTNPAAKADWIDQIRPKYGGWTNVMDALGVFQIFDSIWFRVIAAALVISTTACSLHRIPGMWRTATKPHVGVGEAFFTHAPQRDSVRLAEAPAAALERVTATFRRHHYRTIVEDDGVIHLYADRFRWIPFAGLMAHVAIVVIVLGAIVGAAFGFHDPEFMLAEGSTAAVPTRPGLTVKLERFSDAYYTDTGAPADYASDLILYQDGTEVARRTIRVNDPLTYDGITFYQSFYGPAAAMQVTDSTGKVVVDEGVPLAWTSTDGVRRVGSFTVPSAGYTVWVVGTSGDADTLVKPGQMRLELYQTDDNATPVDAVTVDQGKPTAIGGLTFTFERELQFSGLSLAQDPGAPIIWLGCTLLLVGFVIRFTIPNRRIWARLVAHPDGGSSLAFAGVGRGDPGLGNEFRTLLDDIQTTDEPQQA